MPAMAAGFPPISRHNGGATDRGTMRTVGNGERSIGK